MKQDGVRSARAGRGPGGGVYHAHLYGRRADKYAWLDSHDLSTAGYQPIHPAPPFYFFTPRQTQNPQAYQSWPSVTKIFPTYVTGIVTARDELCIDFDQKDLLRKIEPLRDSKLPDDYIKDYLAALLHRKPSKVENYAWRISDARKQLQTVERPEQCIVPILYRPFDERYIFYHNSIVWRTRPEVMRHMLAGENLGLITRRQQLPVKECTYFFVTDKIISDGVIRSDNRGSESLFPLYLYPSTDSPDMLEQSCRPNLAGWLLPRLSKAYGFTPAPEEVLAYIYAVLYSPTYRQKYAQELRTDFPRIPFPVEGNLFRQMAKLGQRLIDLHLLNDTETVAKFPIEAVESACEQHGEGIQQGFHPFLQRSHTELDPPVARYQGTGSNDKVERVRYDEARQRVYINADKYFEGITPEMWTYRIGGYQVLEKYLKDRKGRRLGDPRRYLRIATAIARTIEVQREIETVYPGVEVSTLVLGEASTAPQGKAGSASEGETSS